MGLNAAYAALLVEARLRGCAFGDVLTIGRQSLTVPRADIEHHAFRLAALSITRRSSIPSQAPMIHRQDPWRHARTRNRRVAVSGCRDLHDLSKPVPAELIESFDTVLDGGSLEPVFDLRQALENYMTMLREGGHLFICSPANNMSGHGLIQFSPELFWRVLSPSNGFEVLDMAMIETSLIRPRPALGTGWSTLLTLRGSAGACSWSIAARHQSSPGTANGDPATVCRTRHPKRLSQKVGAVPRLRILGNIDAASLQALLDLARATKSLSAGAQT